jgi:hypothetical protein
LFKFEIVQILNLFKFKLFEKNQKNQPTSKEATKQNKTRKQRQHKKTGKNDHICLTRPGPQSETHGWSEQRSAPGRSIGIADFGGHNKTGQ